MRLLRKCALLILILCGLNCLVIAIFQWNPAYYVMGPDNTLAVRLVYGVVALSALICSPMLFKRQRHR